MADYVVTAPDGNEHQVSAPDYADDGSIIGFVHNMINQAGNAIQNQWQQGTPYRVAAGALLSGDPSTARQVIEQRFANTTPQDIYSGATNVGLGLAPVGMTKFEIGKNILTNNGENAGYLKLDNTGNALRIADIEVTPSMRGQGIGTSAIKQVMQQAKEDNLPVVLSSDAMRGKESQAKNRALYESLGFTKNKNFKTDGVKEEYIWGQQQ